MSAPALQRLNVRAVERHARRGITKRRVDANRGLMSAERLPGAVRLRFNSGGNWLAAESELVRAGYAVDQLDAPDPALTYGAWMLVTLGGAR